MAHKVKILKTVTSPWGGVLKAGRTETVDSDLYKFLVKEEAIEVGKKKVSSKSKK